jgi:hypothetical protein
MRDKVISETTERVIRNTFDIAADVELSPHEMLAVMDIFFVAVLLQIEVVTGLEFNELAKIVHTRMEMYTHKQTTHEAPDRIQ